MRFKSTVKIVRPANTTAYGNGDVLGAATQRQIETATAAGTITTSGNATVTVTSALTVGSPLAISVAVLRGDTPVEWAAKVRAALQASAAVMADYAVSGPTDKIVLTALAAAANDATLNIALADGTSAGITEAASSANTQAGNASVGSAILEFGQIGPAGGLIEIESATLRIDATSIPAGMTTFRLYLYDTAPTAILDNAAWDLPAGDRNSFLGYIDLGTVLDLGSTLYVQANNIGHRVKLAKDSSSLFGQLVTAAGYTPASGQVHAVTLHATA